MNHSCEECCFNPSSSPCINDPGWKYKCPKCGLNCAASWHCIWVATACAIRCDRCRLTGVLGDSMFLNIPLLEDLYDGWSKDCREFLSMRAKELERMGRLPDYEALEWS